MIYLTSSLARIYPHLTHGSTSNLHKGWPVLGSPGVRFPYTAILFDIDGAGADEVFAGFNIREREPPRFHPPGVFACGLEARAFERALS